uniref:Mitochondrial import inner membrane translocase subunit TIM50 n=1 Tax=Kalanchoe fedtschenkoi TaxID=63787 RepID=A0A7N1A3Y0_KALFE
MSATVRSRRLLSLISRNNARFSSSKPVEESPSILSSATDSVDASLSSQTQTSVDPTPPAKKSFKFLKFALGATLVGASAAAGYATYAYSTDEVEEKTRALRSLARNTVSDDASTLEKFQALVYSSAMAVPAKATELYLDLRRLMEEHVQGFTEPLSDKLLPDMHPMEQGALTLVLDLNETLVYSDWKRDRGWRTFKRPGVDAFLEHLAKFYEIVVYSDQMQMYVDPVIERLDPNHCIRYRLNRSATKYQNGKHYRDLSKLNRDPSKIIYLSGHALETSLQPENSVQIKPWTLQADDTELVDLIPFLEC